ncbi:MAG: hypothetical protein MUP49_00650 [Dehalococcoidia bacterium]|nr:hypothetical protein [Dehalococcoidia bacterium]
MVVSIDPLVAIVTALMAGGLVYVAWKQLSSIHGSSKAEVLRQIEARFSSPPMMGAREQARLIFFELEKRHVSKKETEREQNTITDFTNRLAELKDANDKKYFMLIDICSFYEMVGYLTYKNYVEFDDIYELFGGAILTSGKLFETHIKDLQIGPPKDPKLFERFIWLLDEVRTKYKMTPRR